jgi:hypothetical protein
MGDLQDVIDRQAAGTTGPLVVEMSVGGAGDASAAKQDAQTAILTTIDADTGSIAGAVAARSSTPGAAATGQIGLAVLDIALTDQSGSDADGELTPQRVDTYGSTWVTLSTALSASVDSIAHKAPSALIKKSYNTTSQQTGADVWTPAAGKKIRITDIQVATYGTTGGRLILFMSANADTTYTEGTDETPHKASYVPSATVKPGAIIHFDPAWEAGTADHELHITTDAAISVDLVVLGYEET